MFRDDAGKTEEATPGRLAEAANKGQLPMSKEFTMAASLLFAVLVLGFFGHHLFQALADVLRRGLNVDPSTHPIHEGGMSAILAEIRGALLEFVGPLAVFLVVFALGTALAGYGQIGLKYRPKALKLRPEALNPLNNLQRLISFKSIARTVISALKLAVLGSVFWFVIRARFERFVGLYSSDDLQAALALIIETALITVVAISTAILIISLIDIVYQRWDYKQSMKMTKQEVEDERKRSDGDPFIKGRLREARRELMRQRMMEAVPDADVVITNPTHFAVALKYDRLENSAPEVVAKGVDEVAARIRELADEHDVPRVEDPPLARALFRAVKVGHEIPERFYKAVAAVLGHVFRMRDSAA